MQPVIPCGHAYNQQQDCRSSVKKRMARLVARCRAACRLHRTQRCHAARSVHKASRTMHHAIASECAQSAGRRTDAPGDPGLGGAGRTRVQSAGCYAEARRLHKASRAMHHAIASERAQSAGCRTAASGDPVQSAGCHTDTRSTPGRRTQCITRSLPNTRNQQGAHKLTHAARSASRARFQTRAISRVPY